jgi:hypothetical protein
MNEFQVNQIEARLNSFDGWHSQAKQDVNALLAEVRRLQSENARLCPVADLPTVASLRAELQQCQEQVAMLERMLDGANCTIHRLQSEVASEQFRWVKTSDIHPNPDNIRLTAGWNPGLYNPAHGGTYRVRSLKYGSDNLDESTCCFDIEVGWSTPDEVIEWKELD